MKKTNTILAGTLVLMCFFERIRVSEVRLVDPAGEQIGIKSIEEARWLAAQLELDLVEVAPEARPPVVRLMDYGKFQSEQSVKAREARKKQTRTVIKEVQFRPKIGASDFEVKRRRVVRFLQDNDKVKVTMRFRGREVTHPEIGNDILSRLRDSVSDYGEVETAPRLEGRQMTMVLAPVRNADRVSEDVGTDDETFIVEEIVAEEQTIVSEAIIADDEVIASDEVVVGEEAVVAEEVVADDVDEEESGNVPKMKTHKGAAKRFNRTGSGKVRTTKAWRGHNRHKKSPNRWRRVKGNKILDGGNEKRMNRLLGN